MGASEERYPAANVCAAKILAAFSGCWRASEASLAAAAHVGRNENREHVVRNEIREQERGRNENREHHSRLDCEIFVSREFQAVSY